MIWKCCYCSCLIVLIAFLFAASNSSIIVDYKNEFESGIASLSDSVQVRVAFVFAGSPRSFVHPLIHSSIKHNLIDSFCPPSECTSHIFGRISLSDNSHDGIRYSAKGRMLPHSANKSREIRAALMGLGPIVNISIVDIGSAIEQQEIAAYIDHVVPAHQKLPHRVYSEFDSRRYSMYFNRQSAYLLAQQYESSHNMKFDWIVHARLDFFFGEPVRPYPLWSAARLWVVDQWMYDVPDVFAIIPRRYSDLFYSINELYSNPNVICLGGPDFDNATILESILREKRFADSEISFIYSELCELKYQQSGMVLDRATNHKWSTEGISEVILRRKLKENGISLHENTLGYSSFFAVLVRDPLSFVCANVKPSNFIGWLRSRYRANAAYAMGCYSLDEDLRQLRLFQKNIYSNTVQLVGKGCMDSQMQQAFDKLPESADSSPSFVFDSVCLLNQSITSWNFMPFRLKIESSPICLTVAPKQLRRRFPIMTLEQCNATSSFKSDRIFIDYSIEQLFYFYLDNNRPQRISHLPYEFNLIRYCWTVQSGVNGIEDMNFVVVSKCEERYNASQLFIVESVPSAQISPVVNSARAPENRNVRIRWIGQNQQFCVSIKFFSRRSLRLGKVALQHCDTLLSKTTPISFSKQNSMVTFTAERTRTMSSTTSVPPPDTVIS